MNKQFEECLLEQATHVEVGGKVYELGPNDGHKMRYQVLKYNRYYIRVYMESDGWQLIHAYAFPILGIKPLKEKKREPIEFEALFVKYKGQWHAWHSLDKNVSYQNCKKATFYCVEALEDEDKK